MFIAVGRIDIVSLRSSEMFIAVGRIDIVFAPEERNVYSRDDCTNDLHPVRGAMFIGRDAHVNLALL